MPYDESITDYWNYWCCYRKTIRNKVNGSEVQISTGTYSPSSFGMMRVGKKVTSINSNEESIEYYVSAFQPNMARFNLQDPVTDATLKLFFRDCFLNEGKSSIYITVKPFANSGGGSWTTTSNVGYTDILNHYVPFDMTSSEYASSSYLYEKTENVNFSNYTVLFENIIHLFNKYREGKTIGFTITAADGYCDMHGPSYNMFFIRPKIEVIQSHSNRLSTFMIMDTEINALSKVKGVCRNRNKAIITGKQCRIIVFNPTTYNVVGTGLSSSSDGSFLVDVEEKTGEIVIVSFVDDSGDIDGSEIMATLSYNTT